MFPPGFVGLKPVRGHGLKNFKRGSNIHFPNVVPGMGNGIVTLSLVPKHVGAAARLRAAGGRDFSGIRTVRANDIVARNAFFRGPDGELVELMQVLRGEF